MADLLRSSHPQTYVCLAASELGHDNRFGWTFGDSEPCVYAAGDKTEASEDFSCYCTFTRTADTPASAPTTSGSSSSSGASSGAITTLTSGAAATPTDAAEAEYGADAEAAALVSQPVSTAG